MTDEAGQFNAIGWNFASHQVVNHRKNEYMRREGERVVTTNAVEGFFSILKRGVYGVYQHVSGGAPLPIPLRILFPLQQSGKTRR
jgi:hypothetical protein